MAVKRERWSLIECPVTIEAPRGTHKFQSLFVSPGGIFICTPLPLEGSTQVTVRFTIEGRQVVAHAEVRRLLDQEGAGNRGIDPASGGIEMRIVRMEGDGSQVLAEHIRKILVESGGPGG